MVSTNQRILFFSENLSFFEEIKDVAVDDDLNEFECIVIFPPEKAITNYSEEFWDLVIVDLHEKKVSLTTVEELKRVNPRVPVIVLLPSGFQFASELLIAGAMDVLSKAQLNKPLLRQKIISAFDRQKIEEEVHIRDKILEAVNFAAECFLLDLDWEKTIDEVLARLGGATLSDRVYIFKNEIQTERGLPVSLSADWVGTGIEKKNSLMSQESCTYEETGYKRWREVLSSGEKIHGNVENLPDNEQPKLMKMGVKSLIIALIFTDHTWWGFIGFDRCNQAKGWTQVQAEAIKTAANIFGAALSRQEAEKKLTYLATHGYLTGLPNRMLFEDRFNQAIARAQRGGEKVAVISLDLDKFKFVNDSHGHPVGDRVLLEIGQRLTQALRGSDTCARIGGDEFGIIVETIHNKGDVMHVMEKLNHALASAVTADGKSIQIRASMGAALFPENGTVLDEIMKAANKALYEVKGKQALFKVYEDGQYSWLAEKQIRP